MDMDIEMQTYRHGNGRGKGGKLHNYEDNRKQNNEAVIFYLQWCLVQRRFALNDVIHQCYTVWISLWFCSLDFVILFQFDTLFSVAAGYNIIKLVCIHL